MWVDGSADLTGRLCNSISGAAHKRQENKFSGERLDSWHRSDPLCLRCLLSALRSVHQSVLIIASLTVTKVTSLKATEGGMGNFLMRFQ